VLGIESKCTEPFARHAAEFSAAYDELAEQRLGKRWLAEYRRLRADPLLYRHLDAAQLVRHALGLATCFGDRRITLLYLYWEPENASALPSVHVHRAEVAEFAKRLGGEELSFRAMSYPALWAEWEAMPKLAEHVAALRARYSVAIRERAGVSQ
jgi:hypothetical protein